MIRQLTNLPANVVGFVAEGEVSAEDFQQILLPAVEAHVKQHPDLNYLLELPEDKPNFTMGAWMQDAWLGLKNLTKWNRGVILSDSEVIRNVTSMFSMMVPGEFRVYSKSEEAKAINWLSTGTD